MNPSGFLRRLTLATASLLLAAPLSAQMGDKSYVGDDRQHAPVSAVAIPPSPVLSPQETANSLTTPPGFHVEVVAAEPLIRDPVSMTFDSRGRLWVVEFSTYDVEDFIRQKPPIYLDPTRPVPEIPKCRIVVLEDTDGDGRMDKRTVFLDNLDGPRSVGFIGDRVLVGAPPNLWLYQEHHGVAGERELLAHDYGSLALGADANANGLVWGRDNWLYNVIFKWRMRQVGGRWVREPMPDRMGQWSLTQDDYGRLFYGHNTDHLRGDWLPSYYEARLGLKGLMTGVDFPVAEDQAVWPGRPTTGVNRSYRSSTSFYKKGILHDDGYLMDFTASCGPVLYRGVNFPARYLGNVFTPDPSPNLIKRDLLEETEGRVQAIDSQDQTEFITSTSERFRPVYMANGPDGALYVTDMSRGIIEAFFVITSYLRNQIFERGLNRPLWGMGRIYRVVYDEGPRSALPNFAGVTPDELVRLLAHPNGWTRDMAQRKIVESGNAACVAPLNRLLAAGSERDRVYAIWCLEGLAALTPANLAAGYADTSAHVRMAALRAGEPLFKGPEGEALLQLWSPRIATEEPIVLAQLALSLIGVDSPAARDLRGALLGRAPEHPSLVDATLLAWHGHETDALARLLAASHRRSNLLFGGKVLFQKIARNIVAADRDGDLRLTDAIIDRSTPGWARVALMEGIGEAPGPAFLPSALVERLAADAPDAWVRKAAGVMAESSRRESARRNRSVAPLTADQQILFQEGRETFAACAACHQPTGTGREGVAPSLQDGRWANGTSSEIPIRIVLKGKTGTPGFAGSMIPFSDALSDRQIAGVLTFVRRSWGNKGSAVAASDVTRVRAEVAKRPAPWTDGELERIEGVGK